MYKSESCDIFLKVCYACLDFAFPHCPQEKVSSLDFQRIVGTEDL